MFCGLRSRWEMLRSWRNFRAQAGWADGHVAGGTPPQPYPPPPKKSPGRMPNGVSPGARQGTLTELLQEDARHLLGEDPAHPDEAGEVPPSAELHDQVDVVAVPLRGKWTPSRHPGRSHRVSLPHKVRLDRFAQLLARNPTDTPLGSQDGPQDLSWTSAGSAPPTREAPSPTWKSLSSTMCGWRMVFRISISVSRFSTDARLRLLLLTHLTATTSRVSLCQGGSQPWSPSPTPNKPTWGSFPSLLGGGKGGSRLGRRGKESLTRG